MAPPAARLAGALLVVSLLAAGCVGPYRGPKTLAAIGVGILAGGSAIWIAGERSSHHGLVAPGFTTAVLGASAIVGAAAWLAASVSCRVDPDCPEGEECKEIPAPPGGIPYKQCRRR